MPNAPRPPSVRPSSGPPTSRSGCGWSRRSSSASARRRNGSSARRRSGSSGSRQSATARRRRSARRLAALPGPQHSTSWWTGPRPNGRAPCPDAFGTKRLQLATLRTLLAAEERQLDEREWPIGEVTAITAGKDLADRWAAHQLASSNEPRAAFEVRAGRSGSPITKLGINAEKLWRFFGYPEASGRDYAMPQFTKDGTKFHFSLTGNSMHDLQRALEAGQHDPDVAARADLHGALRDEHRAASAHPHHEGARRGPRLPR